MHDPYAYHGYISIVYNVKFYSLVFDIMNVSCSISKEMLKFHIQNEVNQYSVDIESKRQESIEIKSKAQNESPWT